MKVTAAPQMCNFKKSFWVWVSSSGRYIVFGERLIIKAAGEQGAGSRGKEDFTFFAQRWELELIKRT